MSVGLAPSANIVLRDVDPVGMTWLAGMLWIADARGHRLIEVDPVTGVWGRQIDCPEVSGDLTSQAGLFLQVTGPRRTITAIDIETGLACGEFSNPRDGYHLSGLDVRGREVLAGYSDRTELDTCDLAAAKILSSVEVGSIDGIAATESTIVLASSESARISIVPLSGGGTPQSFEVDGRPAGLAWDGLRLWYCDRSSPRLRALDIPGVAVV